MRDQRPVHRKRVSDVVESGLIIALCLPIRRHLDRLPRRDVEIGTEESLRPFIDFGCEMEAPVTIERLEPPGSRGSPGKRLGTIFKRETGRTRGLFAAR